MKKNNIKYIASSAIIAALYAALTLVNPFSFGQLQFRVSELLTILAAITPAAIPGLSVGCFIANFSSFTPLDTVFGTAATLLAAISAWKLKNIKIKGLPVLSAMMPVLFNSVIIAAELCLFSGQSNILSFLTFAVSVGTSELILCILALLLFPAFEKIFNKILNKK